MQLTCDCSLSFNCDSALLLLSVVVLVSWKIEESGEAMEFLSSLAIAACAFPLEFYYKDMIAMVVEGLVW